MTTPIQVLSGSGFKVSGTGQIVCSAPILLGLNDSYSSNTTQSFILEDPLEAGQQFEVEINWSNAETGRIRFQFEIWESGDRDQGDADKYITSAIRGSNLNERLTTAAVYNGSFSGFVAFPFSDYSVPRPFNNTFYFVITKTTATTTTFEIKESDNSTVWLSETINDQFTENLSLVNRVGFALFDDASANWKITRTL